MIGGNEYILASKQIVQSQLPSQTKIAFSPTSPEVKVKFKYGTSAWTWHGHSICITKPVMVSETYYVDVCDGGDDKYRFGFNGQEKVNEISGVGNHNTAEFWEYETRLGRRWNLDPRPNTSISSYAAFANNPILFNDPFGDTTKYYNMCGKELGTINNSGSLNRIKVNENDYNNFSKGFGEVSDQNLADVFVTTFNSMLDLKESTGMFGNVISRETGNYQLDFCGSVIGTKEMTGKNLGKNHAPYGITGTMFLNSIFDDGSLLSVESYKFTSGPYGNGPTPNNNYSVSYGTNGYNVDGMPVWTPSTSESGMLLNSGKPGWKLRLPNYNGRKGMLIHPDINSIGTAGCIGIRENDKSLIKLGNFFDNYIRVQRRTLQVNFQITNNPNYGNEGKANSNLGQ